MANVRLIKHEAVPQSGSFVIRFPDGRPSKYIYWDDNPGRHSIRSGKVDQAVALRVPKILARAERHALNPARRGISLAGPGNYETTTIQPR